MFKGADTDQMRTAAGTLDQAAVSVEQLVGQIGSTARSLSWTGTDFDNYVSSVESLQVGLGRTVHDMLTQHATLLRQQAQAQDDTSATLEVSGLGSGFFGPGIVGPGFFGPSILGPGGELPRLPWLPNDWFDLFPGDRTWPILPIDPAPWGDWIGGHAEQWWGYVNGDMNGFESKVWSTEHDVAMQQWAADGSTNIGPMSLAGAGSVALLSASAGASAGLAFDKSGLTATAKGQAGAYLVDAKASGSVGAGPVSATGEARAFVGAEVSGEASAHIGPDGAALSAEVDAFAGAKAGAEVGVDVGGVGGTAKGEVWAGIGVQADADVSVTADHVKVGVSVGAALGIGGSLEFEIDVKPKEVVNNVRKFLNPFD